MIRFSFLFGLLCLPALFTTAQDFQTSFVPAEIPNATKAFTHAETGLIRYIEFAASNTISINKPQDWFEQYLQPQTGESWMLLRRETDQIGWEHLRFQHTYKGIIIEDEQYLLHAQNGLIRSANGLYQSIASTSPATPQLSENAAITRAITVIPTDTVVLNVADMEEPTLRWLRIGTNLVLTYKVDVFAMTPLLREYIYVDAQNGEILERRERIHDTDVPASVSTRYSGTQTIIVDSVNATLYRLRETTRGNGVTTLNLQNGQNYGSALEFTDDDNLWDATTNDDDAALDAHFGAEMTYDYFLNEHGRNSYDNQGAELISYVHYGNNFINAFWNGQYMTYGDGNTGAGYTPLTTLTIAGHEMAHGVTEFTAGLIYNAESGALNESFSDIFGVAIDFLHNPNPNYEIGDQINTSGVGFRDMENPNTFSDPDTYLGDFWHTSPADNYGVHTNSGVQNFWFYLLVNGGTGVNDNQDNYVVNGIGLTDAGKIAYRNLSVYLTPNSDYDEAQFYGVQSAADLFGPCAPQTDATVAAWYAVGLGNSMSITPQSDFAATDAYACRVPADIHFNNLSLNADTYEWSFGDGNTSTSANPVHTYNAAGIYTVQLVASSSSGCAGNDTLVLINHVEVEDNGGPISASCVPQTTNGSASQGIYEFELGTIDNTSLGSQTGYQNFSCVAATELIEGTLMPLSIRTGAADLDRIRIWIDMNNDGNFDPNSELVLDETEGSVNELQGEIIVPNGIVFDTPLRMRVLADKESNNTLTPCQSPIDGQVEDYTAIIRANSLPPIANFGAPVTRIPVGGSVSFQDSSLNAPTAWNWTFEGADAPTSNFQNPVMSYSTPGIYTVSLSVSNADGFDDFTRLSYIIVDTIVNVCADESSNMQYGRLYDSGGEFGNYGANENCGFLINPECAIGIDFELTGNMSGGDWLTLYHGTDDNGLILALRSGANINESLQFFQLPVYAKFTSNAASNASGFELIWNAIEPDGKEIVQIQSSRGFLIDAGETSTFTGPSTDYPVNATWDFGDGFTSNDPVVMHQYDAPGVYEISLTTSNCYGDTTFTQRIEVKRDQSVTEPYMIIYPSPGNGEFTVSENYAETVESITVSTAIGQVLIQYEPSYLSNMHTFDLRGFAQGVYYVDVVYSDGERAHGEVIITE